MSAIEFSRPFPIRFSGSPAARWLLQRLGWRVHFEGLPAKQGVLVVYPHTSNWDFVILVLAKWAIGIPVCFWGKDRLFRVPLLGPWLRSLGGGPVNRSASQGVVEQTVDQFVRARAQGRYFWLALSPEGTRKQKPGWRSGFYQTALKARVPLGLVRLDYGRSEVAVRDFIYLTGDVVEDFKRMARAYDGVTGYIPENAAPIRLLEPSVSRSETIVK
ncbi:MAG: 1-acyl-sn-glycerol-3-phosphate acyltransferase [Rhodoferax sp.]|uniref:1-acyl-sn-glycerol-3-phosphate acyltransferase n=1 Tax=Rhodoferax sp. TaxID=50421 RepID=UPI002631A3BE|nr:1-acyl-sn-glycerol-3-phosphate acyltransferase [Rhodoferax sp.]MDD5332531.1 1-acyl-sn-glycerol-3-phosphate acyltransferase [Rhodoferax sp.]